MGSLMAGWNSAILDRRRASLHRVTSLTKQEIESFWRTRRLIEEFCTLVDRFLAGKQSKEKGNSKADNGKEIQIEEKETRAGIKDWWTRSAHAFLNQPPLETMDAVPTYKYTAQYHIVNAASAQ